MDIEAVFLADFMADLTDSLEKRLALDVTYGAADFGDNNVSVGFLADGVDEPLDLVGDMRNNLNGFAEVFAAAFLRDNVRVDLACREVRELVEILAIRNSDGEMYGTNSQTIIKGFKAIIEAFGEPVPFEVLEGVGRSGRTYYYIDIVDD